MRGAWLGIVLLVLAVGVWAQESPPAVARSPDDEVQALPPLDQATVLDTVVVTGVMPGPGLWKVRRDGHVMWLLGTLQPVARRMQWDSTEVERVVASADAILYPPVMKFDFGMGRLRSLFLLPALLGARKNPDGDRLVDHVDAQDYARWLVLKKKYLGRDRGVEKRRPLFAADALYRAALEDSGLEVRGLVSPVLEKVAKRHKIEIERPQIELDVRDPKAAIRDFRASAIDDAVCFRKTLDHLESDIAKMRIRANAWARGDMITLREVTYEDQSRACMDAVLETRFAENLGIADMPARLKTLWLEKAEAMIHAHATSFAALPLGQIVSRDGYLAELAARGYEIEEP